MICGAHNKQISKVRKPQLCKHRKFQALRTPLMLRQTMTVVLIYLPYLTCHYHTNDHMEAGATQNDMGTNYWPLSRTIYAISSPISGVIVDKIVYSNCITRDERSSELCMNCERKDLSVRLHNGTHQAQIHAHEVSPPGCRLASS